MKTFKKTLLVISILAVVSVVTIILILRSWEYNSPDYFPPGISQIDIVHGDNVYDTCYKTTNEDEIWKITTSLHQSEIRNNDCPYKYQWTLRIHKKGPEEVREKIEDDVYLTDGVYFYCISGHFYKNEANACYKFDKSNNSIAKILQDCRQ